MSTILQYNGIQIPFLKTEKFVQEPIWSPDGVDLLYTHIVIGVSGILNKCFLNSLEPAAWVELSRPYLLQRSKQLYFYLNGTQVFPPPTHATDRPSEGTELVSAPSWYGYTASGGGSPSCEQDCRLGPKPIHFDVRQIKGGTIAIYYEIETWMPYCVGATIPATVLSNRWSCDFDIDKDYYQTRATNGMLILNGNYLDNQPGTLQLLANNTGLIIPPLPKNWKRETIHISRSSDGLELQYQIVDRQQYVAIPSPACVIDAHYSEMSPPGNAGGQQSGVPYALQNMQQVTFDCTIAGDPSMNNQNCGQPDTLKYTLMKIMFQLLFSRIQFPFTGTGNIFETNEFITSFELKEDLMKPVVGCRVTALKTRPLSTNSAGPVAWQSNVFNLTNVGDPILVQDMINQVATAPITQGNYAQFLFIQSICPPIYPCDSIYNKTQQAYGYATILASTAVYTSTLTTAKTSSGGGNDGTNSYDTKYSQANYKHPFTEYTGEVTYATDNHILALPIMYDVNQADDNSVEFTTVAPPTTIKIVHWKASRLGSWPKAPKPTSLDLYGDSSPRDKVGKQTFSIGEVELSNDGLTYHYSISGIYEILMARRWQWDASTPSALTSIVNPIIASSVWEDKYSVYPTSLFIDGILDAGSSPANE